MTQSEKRAQIEHSLQKTYKKRLWCNFTKALKIYDLLREGDRVAVCVSGGKDSTLLAMLFKELLRHSEFPFEVEYIVMDPGYRPENRALIESNAALLGLNVHVFEANIFDSVHNVEKNPCYLCARMRRGYLYKFAQDLGCNKIALGHHYDDVIETTLMGMLYGGQIQTMMPKLKSTNFPGMELIRPLYLVREHDIELWRDYNELKFLRCACRFTEASELDENLSKRKEIKALIAEMKKTNPLVESRIFASMENVCLDTVIEYKKDGVRYNFLEEY